MLNFPAFPLWRDEEWASEACSMAYVWIGEDFS
jgi:hypothetical protein